MAIINGTLLDDTLNGTIARDVIYGLAGNDTIDSAGGNDVVYGGDGDDLLAGGLGNDVLYGDIGFDTLYGGAGNDIAYGGDDDDLIFGDIGNDRLYGGAGADILNGGDGRDILDGGTGDDIMIGGLDHDTYYVDSASDFIIEDVAEGTDWVYSTVSYALAANVEHLKLLGTGNFDLFGNVSDNILMGNRGNNTLNGGAGSDTLNGGAGNDTYVINQFDLDGINDGRGGGDYIIDASGIDTVLSNISGGGDDIFYIMQRGLENLEFTSVDTGATIHGNQSNNIIITDAGDDVLDGKRGADTMDGGGGANTFYVDNSRDLIIDTDNDFDVDGVTQLASADTLFVGVKNYTLSATAQVENVTLVGNGINFVGSNTRNVITGSAGRDFIRAGGGNDEILMGTGDTAFGDLGADTFTFLSTETYSIPSIIKDFNVSQGDVLNIADIIDYSSGDILARYVDIVDRGQNSFILVNPEGDGNIANFFAIARIDGVLGLTGEMALVASGNLIVES